MPDPTQLPRSHFSLSQAGSRPLAYLDKCSLTQQKLATYWQLWTVTFQKVLGSASLAAGHWQQPSSSLSHNLLLKQQPKLRGSHPSSHPFLKSVCWHCIYLKKTPQRLQERDINYIWKTWQKMPQNVNEIVTLIRFNIVIKRTKKNTLSYKTKWSLQFILSVGLKI